MPEPKSKTRMIQNLQDERRRLEQNLSRFTPEDMHKAGVVGSWSIKDILAHLADWEAHMPLWVADARQGKPVAEIEPGLNWKQFDAFNQRIYERHCSQPLDEVMSYFRATHRQFMAMVEDMPEDEMLARGRYAFLNGSAIYDWLSAYAAHDRWAKTHIRKWAGLNK